MWVYAPSSMIIILAHYTVLYRWEWKFAGNNGLVPLRFFSMLSL